MTQVEMQIVAVEAARTYQLDPNLVCGVIEQESGWNPNAIRFEGGFYMRYVKPLNLPSETESMSRSFSWGLMQVMGQVAREFGYKGEFLSELCNPIDAIDVGCRVLRSKLNSKPSSVEAGLLAWNGGGNPNYGKEVLQRAAKYSQMAGTEHAITATTGGENATT